MMHVKPSPIDTDLWTRWLRYFYSTEKRDRRGPHAMKHGEAVPDPMVKGASDWFARGVLVRERLAGREDLRRTPEYREARGLSFEAVEAELMRLERVPSWADDDEASRMGDRERLYGPAWWGH